MSPPDAIPTPAAPRERPHGAIRRLKHALDAVEGGPDRVAARLELARAQHGADRHDDALSQLHAALVEAETLDHRALRIRVHTRLSAVYGTLANWRLAMVHATRAVELGERSPKIYSGAARINLALCLWRTHDHPRAIAAFRTAAEDAARWDSPDNHALALNNLGSSLNACGSFPEALVALQAAVALLPHTSAPRQRELSVFCSANLCVALANLGRADEARAQLDLAESRQPDPERSPVILECRFHLSRAMGDPEGALQAIQSCLDVANRQRNPFEYRTSLQDAATLAAETGRWELAWRYERDAADLGRIIYDERRIFALEELKQRHQMELEDLRNTELAEANAALNTANKQLQITADHLHAANQAKSHFLAVVSHELRTPLTGILGTAELLAQQDLGDANHDIDVLLRSGRLMVALLNDLLDTFKLDAGRLELDPVPFRLSEATRGVLSVVSGQAAAKGLTLRAILHADCPDHIIGDDLRYQRVLMNLLSNAVKFTGEGHVALHIHPRSDGIYLEVSDSGIGISGDAQMHLFEPFRQAEKGTTRAFGGTGLGLSITKQIVELLGGDIGVRSTPGDGSTFWVSLPLVVQPGRPRVTHDLDLLQPDLAPAERDFPPSATALAQLTAAGPSVLIIDDDPVAGTIAERMLRSIGARPTLVGSGESGIAFAIEHQPALVLLDWRLPEIDGPEVARRLRAQGFQAPIVALTAHTSINAEPMVEHGQMQAILSKPIALQTLRDLLTQWVPAPTRQKHEGDAT